MIAYAIRYHRTPLHYAGNSEVARILLSAGAAADIIDHEGKVGMQCIS